MLTTSVRHSRAPGVVAVNPNATQTCATAWCGEDGGPKKRTNGLDGNRGGAVGFHQKKDGLTKRNRRFRANNQARARQPKESGVGGYLYLVMNNKRTLLFFEGRKTQHCNSHERGTVDQSELAFYCFSFVFASFAIFLRLPGKAQP